jgi:hypothetical protein
MTGGKDVFTGYNVTSNLAASFIEGTNNILPIELPVSFNTMFNYRVVGINNIYEPRRGTYFLSNNRFDGLALRLFQGLGFSSSVESKIYASNYFLRNFLTSTEHESIFEFMFTKSEPTTNTSLQELQRTFETFSFADQTSRYAKTIVNLWILTLDSTSLNETLSNACGLFDGMNIFGSQIQNDINAIKTVYANNINQFIQDTHTQVLTNIDEYAALSNIVTKLFVSTYSYTDLSTFTTTNYETAIDITYLNTVMSTLVLNLTSLFTNASGFYIIERIQPLVSTLSDMKKLYKEICDPLTSLRLYGIQTNFNKYISENSDFINSTEFASAIIQDSNTQVQIRNTFNYLQTYTFNDSTNIFGRTQFTPLKQDMLDRYNLIPALLGDFNSLATVSTAPLREILNNIIGVVSITKIQEIQNTLSLAILDIIKPYNVGVFDYDTSVPLEIFSDYTPSLTNRALLGLPIPTVYEDDQTFSLLYNGIRLTLRNSTVRFTYQSLITELQYQIGNMVSNNNLTEDRPELPLPYRSMINSRFVTFSITRIGDPTTGYPSIPVFANRYHLQFTWTITPPSADDQTPEAVYYRSNSSSLLANLQNGSDTIQFTDTYSSLYLGFGEQIVDSTGNPIVHTLKGLTPISPYPFLMQSCKASFYLDNFNRLVTNINYLKTFNTIIPAAIDACKIIFDEYFAVGVNKFYDTISEVISKYETNIYDESFINGHGTCNYNNLNDRRNNFARISTLVTFNKAAYNSRRSANTLNFANRFTYISEAITLLAECKVIDDYFTTARAGFKKYADTVKLINSKTASLAESVVRQKNMYNNYVSKPPPNIAVYDGIGEDFIMSVLPTDTRFWTRMPGQDFLQFAEYRSNWPYYDQDTVSYDGYVYQCTGLAFSGIDPTNSDYWVLVNDYTSSQLGVGSIYNKFSRYDQYSYVFYPGTSTLSTGTTGPTGTIPPEGYNGYASKFRFYEDKPDLISYSKGSPYVRKSIDVGFKNLKIAIDERRVSYSLLEQLRNMPDIRTDVGPFLSQFIGDYIESHAYDTESWTNFITQAPLDNYPDFVKWAKDYHREVIDNWTPGGRIGELQQLYNQATMYREFAYGTTRTDQYITDIKNIVDYILNLQPDGKSKAPGSNIYINSPANDDKTRTGLYLELLPYITSRDNEGIFKLVFAAMSASPLNEGSFSFRHAKTVSAALTDYKTKDRIVNGLDSFSMDVVKARVLYTYFNHVGDTTNVKVTDFSDYKEKLGDISVTRQVINGKNNVIGYDPPSSRFVWKLLTPPKYNNSTEYKVNDIVTVNYSIGEAATGNANTFSVVEYKCYNVPKVGFIKGVNPSSDLVYWTQVGTSDVFYNWYPIPFIIQPNSPSGKYAQDGVKKYIAISPKAYSPTREVGRKDMGINGSRPVYETEAGYWREADMFTYTTGDVVYYNDGTTTRRYMALQSVQEIVPLIFPYWIEFSIIGGPISDGSTATGATGTSYPAYNEKVKYNLGDVVYYPNYTSRLYEKYQCINVDVPPKNSTDMTIQQNADYIIGVPPVEDKENLLWRNEDNLYSQPSLINTYRINTSDFDTTRDIIQNALIIQNYNNRIAINENRSSGKTYTASGGLQRYNLLPDYVGYVGLNDIIYVSRPASYGINTIFSSYGTLPFFASTIYRRTIEIDTIRKLYTESEIQLMYDRKPVNVSENELFKDGDCYMNSIGIIFFYSSFFRQFNSPHYIERNRVTKLDGVNGFSMTLENIMDWTHPYYCSRLIELSKSYANNGNRNAIPTNTGPEIYLPDFKYIKGHRILHPKFRGSSVIDLTTLTYIGATPLEQFPPISPTIFSYYPYVYTMASSPTSSPSLDNSKIDPTYDAFAVTPLRTTNFQLNDAIYCSADKSVYIWNGFKWMFGFTIAVSKLYRAPTNFGHYLLYDGTYKLNDRPRYGIGPVCDMWNIPGFLRTMRYEYAIQIEHPKMEIRSKTCLLQKMFTDNSEYDIRTFPFKECDYNEKWQLLKNAYANVDTSKCIGLYPKTQTVVYTPSGLVARPSSTGTTIPKSTTTYNIYTVPNPVDPALNKILTAVNTETTNVYNGILEKRERINTLKQIFYLKDYISSLTKSDKYKYLFVNADTSNPVDLGYGSKNSTCKPEDLRDYMLEQINKSILITKSKKYRESVVEAQNNGLSESASNVTLNIVRENIKTTQDVVSEIQLLSIMQNEIAMLEGEILKSIAYCKGIIGYEILDRILEYTDDGSIKFGIGGICDRNWDATCYTDGVVIPLRGIDMNHNFIYTWSQPNDGTAITTGFGDIFTNRILQLLENYNIFTQNDYRLQKIAPRPSNAGDYIGGFFGALGAALIGLVGVNIVNANSTRKTSYTKYTALWHNARDVYTSYVQQYKPIRTIPLNVLAEIEYLSVPEIIKAAARWGRAKKATQTAIIREDLTIRYPPDPTPDPVPGPTPVPPVPTPPVVVLPPVVDPPTPPQPDPDPPPPPQPDPDPPPPPPPAPDPVPPPPTPELTVAAAIADEVKYWRVFKLSIETTKPISQIPLQPAPPTVPTLTPINPELPDIQLNRPAPPDPKPLLPPPTIAEFKPNKADTDFLAAKDRLFRDTYNPIAGTFIKGATPSAQVKAQIEATRARLADARRNFDAESATAISTVEAANRQIELDNRAAMDAYANGTSPDMQDYIRQLETHTARVQENFRIVQENTINNRKNLAALEAVGIDPRHYDSATGSLKDTYRPEVNTGPNPNVPIGGLEGLESRGLRTVTIKAVEVYGPSKAEFLFATRLSREATTPSPRLVDPNVATVLAEGTRAIELSRNPSVAVLGLPLPEATLLPANTTTERLVEASTRLEGLRDLAAVTVTLTASTARPPDGTTPIDIAGVAQVSADVRAATKDLEEYTGLLETQEEGARKTLAETVGGAENPTAVVDQKINATKQNSKSIYERIRVSRGQIAAAGMGLIGVSGTAVTLFTSVHNPNQLVEYLGKPESIAGIAGLADAATIFIKSARIAARIGMLTGGIDLVCSVVSVFNAISTGEASEVMYATAALAISFLGVTPLAPLAIVAQVFISFHKNIVQGDWISDTQY